MALIVSIFFPSLMIPVLIIIAVMAFVILNTWIHLSYFGWSFSGGDIKHHREGWKISWIIIIAWLTIIASISDLSYIIFSSPRPSIMTTPRKRTPRKK